MSVEVTKLLLKSFLEDERNDVLALTGAWGVGKTYVWDQALKASKDKIKKTKYCYVSLFGINTMKELRMALFVKSVSTSTIGTKLDFETVNKDWLELGRNLGRSISTGLSAIAQKVPNGGAVSVGIEMIAPHFVRETLICIDDFERKSELKPQDILGLINELKEEKKCKVVLIFNAEKLASKDEYRAYKEKVIDLEVLYAPTVDEAFQLVFDAAIPCKEKLLGHVRNLEITNIRILRKIQRIVTLLDAATEKLHEGVREASLASAVLLCWVAYAPDAKKPKIEEISKWNNELISVNTSERVADVAAWVSKLHSYGFQMVDDLDIAIAQVVERGYVEDSGFVKAASAMDANLRGQDAYRPFTAVWRRFRESFSDDQDQFIADLHSTALQAMEKISQTDLNSAVVLLRQLERDDLADDLITKFVEVNKSTPRSFDLSSHPFGGSISDTQLRLKFESVHKELAQLPTAKEALLFMVQHSGYGPQHIAALKDATVEDFLEIFQGQYDETVFPEMVRWSTQWSDSEHEEIAVKAKEALQRIKATSKLNAVRVARFGG